MTVTVTERFSIYRWDSGGDAFTRAQMDTSHANIEANAAKFLTGATTPPASNIANAKTFYLDTSTGILYYSAAGTSWVTVNSFAAPSSTLTPGDSNSAGSAATAARSDHSHAMLAFSATATSVSTATAAGSASTYSRGDHTHNLANNSVTAGTIASGAINSSTAFGTGVVGTTAIADTAVTRAKIADSERIPVGTIMPYAGTTEPTGWLFCNGQQVLASGDLGTVLSTRFNTGGETAGYVRVPNLQSRFMHGAATMTAPSTGIGTTSGASTATLAEANLPSHTHAVGTLAVASHGTHDHSFSATSGSTDLSHVHDIAHTHTSTTTGSDGIHAHTIRSAVINTGTGTSGTATVANTSGSFSSAYIANSSSHSHTVSVPAHAGNSGAASVTMSHSHTVSGTSGNSPELTHTVSGATAATGSGTAFAIIPPAITMNFIIKS